MSTPQDHDLTVWLGPARDELDDDQYAEFTRLVRAALDLHPQWTADAEAPADYADEITAAHVAALEQVTGVLDLGARGDAWRAARTALRASVVAAVHGGMPQAQAARAAGVDRMSVRAWLGLDGRWAKG